MMPASRSFLSLWTKRLKELEASVPALARHIACLSSGGNGFVGMVPACPESSSTHRSVNPFFFMIAWAFLTSGDHLENTPMTSVAPSSPHED